MLKYTEIISTIIHEYKLFPPYRKWQISQYERVGTFRKSESFHTVKKLKIESHKADTLTAHNPM